MSAYQDLMAYARQTTALSEVAGRLGWDQETMMPRGAAQQRGEESAAMAAIIHERVTDAGQGAFSNARAAETVLLGKADQLGDIPVDGRFFLLEQFRNGAQQLLDLADRAADKGGGERTTNHHDQAGNVEESAHTVRRQHRHADHQDQTAE